MSAQRFKVVLLGEGRVGKTSILLRYTRGTIMNITNSFIVILIFLFIKYIYKQTS